MEGWIKIHRKIKDHWLWNSDHRLKWWIDILLTVNHADTKVLIKGKLIECKRGQSVRSLETWAKDWNVTKKTVKDYFELLQKDSMLVYESIKISTRITVCNYVDYQEVVNAQYTESKRRVNGEYTDTAPKQEGIRIIKNEEEIIEERKIKFKESVFIFKNQYSEAMLQLFFEYWTERTEGTKKMRYEKETVFEISKRLITWKRNEDKFKNNGHTNQNNSRSVKASNSDWDL